MKPEMMEYELRRMDEILYKQGKQLSALWNIVTVLASTRKNREYIYELLKKVNVHLPVIVKHPRTISREDAKYEAHKLLLALQARLDEIQGRVKDEDLKADIHAAIDEIDDVGMDICGIVDKIEE